MIQGNWGEGVKEVDTSNEMVEENNYVDVDLKSEPVNEKNVEILVGMNDNKNVTVAASTTSPAKKIEAKSANVKKVWTKLRNGLYGWRRVTTARRRCPPSCTPPRSREGRTGP